MNTFYGFRINAYKYQLESTCCNGLQLLCRYIIGTFGSECFSLQEKLVKFLPQVGGILWDTWMNPPGFSQEMVGILCVSSCQPLNSVLFLVGIWREDICSRQLALCILIYPLSSFGDMVRQNTLEQLPLKFRFTTFPTHKVIYTIFTTLQYKQWVPKSSKITMEFGLWPHVHFAHFTLP